jgi:hypothetical protein
MLSARTYFQYSLDLDLDLDLDLVLVFVSDLLLCEVKLKDSNRHVPGGRKELLECFFLFWEGRGELRKRRQG